MPKTTYYERAERRRKSLPSVIVGGLLGIVLVLGIIFSPDYRVEQPTPSTVNTQPK
ncbi:hypothetical protein SEA_STICKYNOTE_79 [Corynebacterium phage Stickynote]|uniref:Uncharacterized protein n=2 Tax=Ceetrepovirus TaxID=2560111 RepID=A0A2H4P8H1_9CAUD|nr:hypothetical protein FDJ11_gp66 [Corynebacterium phage Darwin]YP_010103275.1 hypothetical protein KNU65_gp63 [Corynebacterium phage Stickynote]ATW58541.1 hypothetical protein SEA_DARWIN_82 [Corynebacterium phage Darwin]QDF19272.1 hypothetical protein SEA_STICKYNOTE_79 [Corynebacterium phage Stickynote]